MALTHTPLVDESFRCPDFKLKAVDGKTYSNPDFQGSKFLAVVFMCNHCPYVKAIEDRLIQVAKDIRELGGSFVGISSNDSEKYPEDSFENLQKRWRDKSYDFPYLFDETQSVAKAFDAVCTPDFFVFDAKGFLKYRGRLDDSWKEPELVTKRELLEACRAIANGKSVPDQTPSMGCSIKWRSNKI
ncbi:MAG: thioredoxin family protein [Bdellovibrionales bacterium]|nr:thioredoxin family protein [Bdellovibrionales bacterium]